MIVKKNYDAESAKARLSEIRREIGRKGGMARSEAKAEAARKNGSIGKPVSRSRWLSRNGLNLHKTAAGWYVMKSGDESAQTVSIWHTPDEAINNWASEHGFDGPKGGKSNGM